MVLFLASIFFHINFQMKLIFVFNYMEFTAVKEHESEMIHTHTQTLTTLTVTLFDSVSDWIIVQFSSVQLLYCPMQQKSKRQKTQENIQQHKQHSQQLKQR